MLCHCHLLLPGSDHPHRECHSPTPRTTLGAAGLGPSPGTLAEESLEKTDLPIPGDNAGGALGSRRHSWPLLLALSMGLAGQGMTHRSGKSSRFLWPAGGRSGMGFGSSELSRGRAFVSKINLLLCLWLIIKWAEPSACRRPPTSLPARGPQNSHSSGVASSHNRAGAPGLPSWLCFTPTPSMPGKDFLHFPHTSPCQEGMHLIPHTGSCCCLPHRTPTWTRR